MANEIYVHREGTLSLVQASASAGAASGARVWGTGASPVSAMAIAYVESFSYTSARQIATQSNRGLPTHHKITMSDPIQVTFNVRFTGVWPTAATAVGASTPMWHAELKEIASTQSAYFQFHGLALQQMQFSENPDGNTLALTFPALGMIGATASGYLS